MALEANYLRVAGAQLAGQALLAGVAVSLLAFILAAAFGKPGVLVVAGALGCSCLYGALIHGYREWRAHYVYWRAAGLNDDQIRQKWRDLHDAEN